MSLTDQISSTNFASNSFFWEGLFLGSSLTATCHIHNCKYNYFSNIVFSVWPERAFEIIFFYTFFGFILCRMRGAVKLPQNGLLYT